MGNSEGRDNGVPAIKFSAWQWVSLIAMISGAIAYDLNNQQTKLDNLDNKFETRLKAQQDYFDHKIETIIQNMPPQWVRDDLKRLNTLVIDHEQRIREEEKEGRQ